MYLYKYLLVIAIIIFNTLNVLPLQAVPSNKKSGDYDKYMQEGYSATQSRDYKKATEYFNKALQAQPEDYYAKQALKNVKISQNRGNKPANNNLFIYIVGGLLTVGVGLVAIPLLLNRKRAKNPTQRRYESATEEEENTISFSRPTSSPEEKESSLELQQTTRIANVDVIEDLIRDLQDPDPKKRKKAIWEIAQKGDSRAMKPLVHLMIESDSLERGLILESLTQVCMRTIKPINQALAIALQDQNPQVRKNAIRDLTRIYTIMSQVNQLISMSLEDPDPEVQETAKWAAQQLNTQSRPDHNSHKMPNSSFLEDSKDV